jgi:hypothetical protein
MGADGPEITHGLADWIHHAEPSNARTNASVQPVLGRQKLAVMLRKRPHLRPRAAKLVRDGMTDPWLILYTLSR